MGETSVFVQRGLTLFDSGYSCAEAVFLAAMEQVGIEDPLIPKIATGFAGGVSRTKSLCGALSGGVLALGALHGRTKPSDDRSALMARVQEMMHGFRERHGSDNCFTLTGLDFDDPGAAEKYKVQIHTQCRGYVKDVLEFLETTLPAHA
jgi:C_GCAxxG_C_C family probable redox protein